MISLNGLFSDELSPSKDLHHLSFDKSKDTWKLRLTLFSGKIFKGRQICISLGRCTEDAAIAQRDLIIEAFGKAGIEVAFRRQRRDKSTAS